MCTAIVVDQASSKGEQCQFKLEPFLNTGHSDGAIEQQGRRLGISWCLGGLLPAQQSALRAS